MVCGGGSGRPLGGGPLRPCACVRPPGPRFLPAVPGPGGLAAPGPRQQEVADEGLHGPPSPPRPAGAVIHKGGGPGLGRGRGSPGRTSTPSRGIDVPNGRTASWSVGVGPPPRAGERWRERLGPGLLVSPAPRAARTKPVGRVCRPGCGRGRPEAPPPIPAPPLGSWEQRPSVCSGAVRTMAPEFYPGARGGARRAHSTSPYSPHMGFLLLRRGRRGNPWRFAKARPYS